MLGVAAWRHHSWITEATLMPGHLAGCGGHATFRDLSPGDSQDASLGMLMILAGLPGLTVSV